LWKVSEKAEAVVDTSLEVEVRKKVEVDSVEIAEQQAVAVFARCYIEGQCYQKGLWIGVAVGLSEPARKGLPLRELRR
jgi:hypothetical protein